jgi:DNA repair exonuclease SbcCD ATPase subunit
MLLANLTNAFIFIPFVAALVLGFTIHFFIKSRRALKEIENSGKKRAMVSSAVDDDIPEALKPKPAEPQIIEDDVTPLVQTAVAEDKAIIKPAAQADLPVNAFSSVKAALAQQQSSLADLIEKIDNIEEETSLALIHQNEQLLERVEHLEWQLEKKEHELQKFKQQEAVVQKMASRLEEANKEFELLQNKINSLEKQASKANNLAMELEDMQDAYSAIKNELRQKSEKLDQILAENQRLHDQLSDIDSKLQEANTQRQQFSKKVKLLEELNNDFQSVSESNKKLQSELRRISELESMLNMISEDAGPKLKK